VGGGGEESGATDRAYLGSRIEDQSRMAGECNRVHANVLTGMDELWEF